MSDDPEFSRRDFLRGLGAAMAASAAPTDVIETAAAAVVQEIHPLARDLATNVWHLHEPYYAHYLNNFQDLRTEVVQYLTDLPKNNAAVDAVRDLTCLPEDSTKDPNAYEETMRAYRDAARLLESGWTPPPRLLPDPWTRTAEDHDAAREEPHRASAVQQTSIGQQGEPDTIANPAAVERAEHPDLAANPDPVGIPVRFPDGGISVHLGDGEWQDIDRVPGAFTAVRLWPHHSNGVEDYRLYDHTGTQIAQADVAIIDERAHIANIEAEGGAHALGIRALRTLGAKLQEEFPELVGVTGLRSSGASPGRIQEVEFNPPIRNEGEPPTRLAASTEAYRQDFDGAVARLSAETGLPYTPAAEGEFVAGTYRQSLTLTSGRYAMIDNGLGFALVPWTPELDRHLGRHVAGVAKESGGIEWNFGRKRGLEI
jgi:hypothetical protein